jgi:aconitase B
MFDFFHDVADKAKAGSANAKAVMQSWADAEWFTQRPDVPKKISVTVFKVTGETNTDDLSPAPDAWSRPDIPLHALAMLKNARDGITPEKPGERGPMNLIEDLKKKGHPVAYVGDVVGTGSSAQVGHQFRVVVDRRRHPLRPQQALRRLLPGQQDRPDLLQHPGRCRRLPHRVRCRADGHGRRDRHLPL